MSRIEAAPPMAPPMRRPEMATAPILVDLPMKNIPYNRDFLTGNKLMVADHESNHVFAALDNGVKVAHISTNRDGNSLGRTILAGIPPLSTLQIIAAAGKHDTPRGEATGYGSDMFKVVWGAQYDDGIAVNDAVEGAGESIVRFDPWRKKFAEIVACIGEVPGDLIPLIFKRVQAELDVEKMLSEGKKVHIPLPTEEFKVDQEELPEDRTEIEDFGDKGSKIQIIVEGKVQKELWACPLCGGLDGHILGCAQIEGAETSKDVHEQKIESEKSDVISKDDDQNEKKYYSSSGRSRRMCHNCNQMHSRRRPCQPTGNIDKNTKLNFPTFPKSANIFTGRNPMRLK